MRAPRPIAVVVAIAGLGVATSAFAQPGEPGADPGLVEPDEEEEGEAAEAEADDGELAELSLEELLAVEIVTASNMNEQQSRAPGVVIRLSREDLEARGYRELLDVFDDLPGMDVVRPWGDNYLKVYWRGYRTDTTHPFLVMIDGMAVNSLWSGDASVAAAIPISEIDHIEVVYGPASAVWGANAFMGVVNVITVAGSGEDEDVFRLRLSGGSYHADRLDQRIIDGLIVRDHGALRLRVAGRVALNWTDAGASERFEYTGSRYADDPTLWGGYLGFENLARGTDSPIDQYGLDARVTAGGLELGVISLTLSTGYGLVYPTDRAQPYAHWIQQERTAFASYRGDLTDGVTSRSLFRVRDSGIPNRSYFLSGYDVGTPPDRIVELSYWQAQNRSMSLAQSVQVDRWDWLSLVAGLRYERKDLQGAYDITTGPLLEPIDVGRDVELPGPPGDELRDVERPITDDYGVFSQARLRRADVLTPGDAHALHVGLGYDHNSVFGDAHSPTLRLAYVGELENCRGLFLGKLLYGEGFHEPNPRQLYGGWLGSGSSPLLRPEQSRTLELNLSHTTDQISNLVSAYYVRNTDTIVQFAGGATNKGTRTVAGVDYHLQALLRPPGFDLLSLWGYYSFIWSEELTFDAADQEVRAPIGDLAAHKAWLGGTAQLAGRVTTTLRSRLFATRQTVATNPVREINGAMIFDATVKVDHVGADPVSLSLQVENLLDTDYSHPGIRTADSGEEPGRWDRATWVGSQSYYNSRLPQPGRRIMLTLGLDL